MVLWKVSVWKESLTPSFLIQAFCLLVSAFFLKFLSQIPSLSFMGDKQACWGSRTGGAEAGRITTYQPDCCMKTELFSRK